MFYIGYKRSHWYIIYFEVLSFVINGHRCRFLCFFSISLKSFWHKEREKEWRKNGSRRVLPRKRVIILWQTRMDSVKWLDVKTMDARRQVIIINYTYINAQAVHIFIILFLYIFLFIFIPASLSVKKSLPEEEEGVNSFVMCVDECLCWREGLPRSLRRICRRNLWNLGTCLEICNCYIIK